MLYYLTDCFSLLQISMIESQSNENMMLFTSSRLSYNIPIEKHKVLCILGAISTLSDQF